MLVQRFKSGKCRLCGDDVTHVDVDFRGAAAYRISLSLFHAYCPLCEQYRHSLGMVCPEYSTSEDVREGKDLG